MQRFCALGLLLCYLAPAFGTTEEIRGTSVAGKLPVYNLDIRLQPEARRMEVEGRVTLPATNAPRQEFRLVLSAQMRDFRVQIVAPSGCEGDAKLETLKSVKGETTWGIKSPRAVPANSPVTLLIRYAGGEKPAAQFDFQPECCIASGYGTNWYPQVEGDNDRGTGSLRFSVPAGQIILATGTLVSDKKDEEQGRFRFEIRQPSTLSFAAGKYRVFEKRAPVPIRLCLLRARPNAKEALGRCTEIVNFLVRPEYRAEAKAVAPYLLADIERDRGRLARAEAMFKEALVKVPALDLHGERFLLEYGLARVYADQKKMKEAREHLDAALASPTRRADTLPWAYYGYALLAKALNDKELLRWAVNAAALADAVAPVPSDASRLARAFLPQSGQKPND
jgi:hypothetical protein